MRYCILLALLCPYFAYSQSCIPDDIYAVENANAVCYEIVDNVRNFYTNNYPDHSDSYSSPFDLATSDTEYSMCAYPEQAADFTPLYEETETSVGCTFIYTFGVGLNGVKYDPSSAEYFENTSTGENNIEWHKEARYMFSANFGNNGGHLNPFGEYHYHDVPADYYINDLGIDGSAHSPIVGYAADGFPMYYKYVYSDPEDSGSEIAAFSSGYSLKSGTRPGDGVSAPDGAYSGLYYEDYEYSSSASELDQCNGRYGVTPDFPYGTYYYVLTDNYPYIPRCFKGTSVDHTFRVGPGPSCPASTAATDCAAVVSGCMDPFSSNYNPNANVDDGSCAYGCETSITIASQTNVLCHGGASGSVTVSVSGFGDSPTYAWSGGGTGATKDNLAAGTYEVTVSGGGCSDVMEVTITESDEITYTVAPVDASCSTADGSLVFAAAGGDGGPYQYSINNGTDFQSSGTFDNLAAGTYSVLIKDASGCQITGSGTVNEGGAPNAPTVSGDVAYCSGATIDDLTVSGGGGTFTWYGDEALTDELATGSTFSPSDAIGSITYYVTETLEGCESTASSVTVTIHELPAVAANASAASICTGEAVTLTGSGASTYTWDNGVTDGEPFSPEETATYIVTGTDANGCIASAEVAVVVQTPLVQVERNGPVLTASAGNATFQWINCETNDPIAGETGSEFRPQGSGAYAVQASTAGCTVLSECFQFQVLGITDQQPIDVYPNPAGNILNIQLEKSTPALVELLSLGGNVLKSEYFAGEENISLDLTLLNQGLYIVRVTRKGEVYLLRVIKDNNDW